MLIWFHRRKNQRDVERLSQEGSFVRYRVAKKTITAEVLFQLIEIS